MREPSKVMDDSVASFRRSAGLTQAELAAELGVASKAYVSDLERGKKPWPLKLALRLEQVSGGRVPANTICRDAAALEVRTAAGELQP